MWAVNKHTGQRKWVQCHLPQCAWKGESLYERLAHKRTLSKQSLWGQVSVKLTAEIYINNTSSNSRLTAAGRQATAINTIHRTVSRHFFFSSLPTFDEKTTELQLHAEKLTETVLHFFGSFVLLHGSPLIWQLHNNTLAPSPALETETDTKIIKTETSLHLNLEFFFFFFILFYFICTYIYIYIIHLLLFYFYSNHYSFYFLFSILSLSL
jgi:hypothetical protein